MVARTAALYTRIFFKRKLHFTFLFFFVVVLFVVVVVACQSGRKCSVKECVHSAVEHQRGHRWFGGSVVAMGG